MTGPDYILDLSHNNPHNNTHSDTQGHAGGNPWLAIHWRCCNVYSRIYRQPNAQSYDGRCPKCGRTIRIPVGPTGTSSRFFEAQ